MSKKLIILLIIASLIIISTIVLVIYKIDQKKHQEEQNNQEIVNCNTDYNCLLKQVSQGKSAKITMDEEIPSLYIQEKSEVQVEPYNSQYKVTLKILDLQRKQQSSGVKSGLQAIAPTCPSILTHLNDLISTSATCYVPTVEEAKNLAENGLTQDAIKKYNCFGDLITQIQNICSTNSIFPVGVKKPAVYLYPTKTTNVKVSLSINGYISKSEPEYANGWQVTAQPSGLIDNKYDYLFYEAQLSNLELPNEGWVVAGNNLKNWFDVNLTNLGLNEKEKSQFEEYWLNELPENNFYEIKLLDNNFLDKNMALNISPQPDTIIRLNFYFKPLEKEIKINKPSIITPQRQGFTVVEWGGILGN